MADDVLFYKSFHGVSARGHSSSSLAAPSWQSAWKEANYPAFNNHENEESDSDSDSDSDRGDDDADDDGDDDDDDGYMLHVH